MYYIDKNQLVERLAFIPYLKHGCMLLLQEGEQENVLNNFAHERILHLAIETVTDVGSLMIDGFLMRDASSYEDIIEILRGEQVISDTVAHILNQLVRLRKPLVQDYIHWNHAERHPLLAELPEVLQQFADNIHAFLQREL